MELEVLGAHNSESSDSKLVSLLIDRTIAIDAGGLTSSLPFSAQQQIKAILITHHHFDHIRDLATFGMNTYLWGPTDVYALESVLGVISTHVLNEVLYPDFQQKPLPDKPSLRFCPVEPNKKLTIEGYSVLPVSVNHHVPAVGYQVISPDNKSIFYTGDTGSGCASCWELVSPQLLIIEVTMPDRFEFVAQATGHLSPRLLRQELLDFKRIKGYLPPILVVHMSPQLESEIREGVAQVAKELEAKITMGGEGMKFVL